MAEHEIDFAAIVLAPAHLADDTLEGVAAALHSAAASAGKTQRLDGRAAVVYVRAAPASLSKTALAAIEAPRSVQIALLPAAVYAAETRLAVFDMDSTIIQQEVIDLLAAEAGVEAQVAAITERAMNGELDFRQSLEARAALLAGLDAGVFERVKARITLTPGAAGLVAELRRRGATTALISGGFLVLAAWVAGRLGIDHVHANTLETEGGVLTGRLAPGCAVVDAQRKRQLLGELQASLGIGQAATLAVGDGANDLPMLLAAGTGVAVNAKPAVQRAAPVRLNGPFALGNVGYVLGWGYGADAAADEAAAGRSVAGGGGA